MVAKSFCNHKPVLDDLGDHVSTCTVHSGTKKAHDWEVDNSLTYFAQHIGGKDSTGDQDPGSVM